MGLRYIMESGVVSQGERTRAHGATADQRRFLFPGASVVPGFTLIELMVAVSVVGVLLSLAAPSFSDLVASNRMSSQANEFMGSLQLARSEAVRRSQPVTLRAADDNYSKGWTVFADSNGDGSAASATNPADGLPIREISTLGGSVALKRQICTGSPCTFANSTTDPGRKFVVFTARGAISASTPAYFKICDPSKPLAKGRLLQVNVVGKISVLNSSQSCV